MNDMEITTERLVLRELTPEDWEAIYAYQADARYLRYYPWLERTPADVRLFLDMLLAWQRAEPRFRFQLAITLRHSGRLIGNVGIRQVHRDATEAELGYEIAPEEWGHGYATEAARAMLAFAFETLELARVRASVVARNRASVHVLEKLGLRRIRGARRLEWMKGRWWAVLGYGISREEWTQAQAAVAGASDPPISPPPR